MNQNLLNLSNFPRTKLTTHHVKILKLNLYIDCIQSEVILINYQNSNINIKGKETKKKENQLMASGFSLVIFLALSISVSATATSYSNTVSEPLLSACRLTPESEICLKYLSMFPKSLTENIHNITALSIRYTYIILFISFI